MSKRQWLQAWVFTGYAAKGMPLVEFQDEVMMGHIKLKWVKRPVNENHSH